MRKFLALSFLMFSVPGFGQQAQNLPLTINVFSTPDACLSSTGSAFVIANGTPPYTYLWSDGSTGDSLTNLSAGTYYITVTDLNGDSVSDTITITNENNLHGPGSTSGFSYGFTSEAFIWLNMSNGVPPFTMNWCDSVISPPDFDYSLGRYTLSGTSTSGTCIQTPSSVQYSVLITDANGCSVLRSNLGVGARGFADPTPYVHGSCSGVNNGYILDTLDFSDPGFIVNGQPFQWNDQVTVTAILKDQISLAIIATENMFFSSNHTYDFQNLAPGNYLIEYEIFNTANGGYNMLFKTVNITVPDLGTDCGMLSGKVFVDQNSDCIFNGTDQHQPYAILEIQPGNIFATTNASGQYLIPLPYGNYTITHYPSFGAPLTAVCPAVQPYGFILDSTTTPLVIDFADAGTGLDLLSTIDITEANPGFTSVINATAMNVSANYYTSGDSLVVTYDPTFTAAAYSETPDFAFPGYAAWHLDALSPLASHTYTISVTLPPNPALIGLSTIVISEIKHLSADLSASNDIDSVSRIITGSFDPNEKHVSPEGYTSLHLLPLDYPHLDYTIEFQNTGNDTAQFVIILDTLDADLDITTVFPISSSHPYTFEILQGRVLKFSFYNIQLPDSGSNLEESKGYINFRIQMMSNLPAGTQIHNSAAIYFDFNPPIITNISDLELYDCNNLLNTLIVPNPLCEGDNILLNAGSMIPVEYLWEYDNQPVSYADSLFLANITAGTHTLELTATTPYCADTFGMFMTVDPLPAVTIQINGNTLNAITNATTAQWFLHNVPIPGATSMQWIAQQTGNYSVVVSDPQGCSNTSQTVLITTGLNDWQPDPELQVMPNPGNSGILISTTLAGNIRLKVYAYTGQLVNDMQLETGTTYVSTASWPEGIYLFEIESGIDTRRIVWIKQ